MLLKFVPPMNYNAVQSLTDSVRVASRQWDEKEGSRGTDVGDTLPEGHTERAGGQEAPNTGPVSAGCLRA